MPTPQNGKTVHTSREWIADAELFRELFTQAAATFATPALAAGAMGCDRSLVVKLRGGQIGRWVKASVVSGMRTALRKDAAALKRLTRALNSETEHEAITAHAEWTAQQHRYLEFVGRTIYVRLNGTHMSHVVKFGKDLAKRGFHEHTISLAVLRALEPLAAAEYAGGIELTMGELAARGRLGTYLIAALKREEILLSRTPDPKRRAQELATPKRAARIEKQLRAALSEPEPLWPVNADNDDATLDRMANQKIAAHSALLASAPPKTKRARK